MLALDALKKSHRAGPLYIKTFAQKGEALIGELQINTCIHEYSPIISLYVATLPNFHDSGGVRRWHATANQSAMQVACL